eukprot:1899917-Amphidinium_carterae.1
MRPICSSGLERRAAMEELVRKWEQTTNCNQSHIFNIRFEHVGSKLDARTNPVLRGSVLVSFKWWSTAAKHRGARKFHSIKRHPKLWMLTKRERYTLP